jgi:hypothetical protein
VITVKHYTTRSRGGMLEFVVKDVKLFGLILIYRRKEQLV